MNFSSHHFVENPYIAHAQPELRPRDATETLDSRLEILVGRSRRWRSMASCTSARRLALSFSKSRTASGAFITVRHSIKIATRRDLPSPTPRWRWTTFSRLSSALAAMGLVLAGAGAVDSHAYHNGLKRRSFTAKFQYSVKLVPGVGLEPTRVFTQRILSPLRLPVSSPRRGPPEPIICSCHEVLKRGEISFAAISVSRISHSF